jgi:hypothetical protein
MPRTTQITDVMGFSLAFVIRKVRNKFNKTVSINF